MKKDIAPEVLAFLKNLPNMPCSKDGEGTITKEDEARIKIMLSDATDPQAQADREALRQYILNQDFKDAMAITDVDRKKIGKYLQKYDPEFFKFLLNKYISNT